MYRAAAVLRTALVGTTISRFESVGLVGPIPQVGAAIERVENHGKQLEIVFDDGIVLHTQFRLRGTWHAYHVGQKWKRRRHLAHVIIETEDWVAVAFGTRVAETYRQCVFQTHQLIEFHCNFDTVLHEHRGERLRRPLACVTEVDVLIVALAQRLQSLDRQQIHRIDFRASIHARQICCTPCSGRCQRQCSPDPL